MEWPDNKAAVLGRGLAWWQDWRGECAAIVASGPSTKMANVAALRDRIHVVAIKESVNLCPWADIVYGCDGPWWEHRKGLPEFKGIKISQEVQVCEKYSLHHLKVIVRNDGLLLDKPGTVAAGGNSGFQALNLLLQFGCTGILLIGFDMQGRGGEHWYGRNQWGNANNPDQMAFARWVRALTGVAPAIKSMGVDVVNASPASALNCFRKTTVENALQGWGL